MCLAIPGKIMTIDVEPNFGWRQGKVMFGGIHKVVCLDYTPQAQVGEYVLVHVGFALSIIDEEEAERTFEALQQLGLLEELNESAT